jgi:hypothetical protein
MSNNFDGTLKVSSWGATKFVETSKAAIDQVRLSQVVTFPQRVLSVGWVSTYLLVSKADQSVDFSVTVELRNCDEDGNPTSLLGSDTLLSSELTADGWYKFELNVSEMDNPVNGLCFVYWQTDGDENNYASWGYNAGNYSGAMISYNSGGLWAPEDGIHRTMRVAANFDAFSQVVTNKKIVTPGGTGSFGENFTGGTYDNTILASDPSPYYGYQQEGSQKIVLDSKDLHVSIVADSSGSMGWRDRFGVRKAVAEELVSRFREDYPGVVTFDFVNFGGRPLDIVPVSQSKRVLGVLVSIDDVSVISGFDSDGNPLLASDVRDHLGTGVVSYGFKGMKPGTTYVNYGFSLGWSDFRFDSADSKWIDMWESGSPSIPIGTGGPDGEAALDMTVSDSAKDSVRYVYGTGDNTPRSFLTSDVTSGDNIVSLDNTAPLFEANSVINVAGRNGISGNRQVISTSDTSITVDTSFDLSHLIADGATVESHLSSSFGNGWGQTDAIEFFLLDSNQLGPISFYVQTANGAHIEWEFTPLSEWEQVNLYYLDETALFDVETVDGNGDPLSDGTTVEFYVDKKPEEDLGIDTENEQETIPLTADAAADQSNVYVSLNDIGKFSRGDSIDVIDDNRAPQDLADGGVKEYHTSVITSLVEGTGKITLSDPLPTAFLVDDGAAILLPSTDEGEFDTNLKVELPITAGLVDVTPIYSGEKVDEELRDQIDPPQVSPEAGYDDYNADTERVKEGAIELTTKNGYAAIRLLPVTEDRFMSAETKDSFAKSMFDLTEREQVRQLALEDMEKGEMKEGADDATLEETQEPDPIEVPPEYFDGEPDFIMDHKVTSLNGLASTDMTSFTLELEDVTLGTLNPRDYLAKKYAINPVMTLYDTLGEKFAIVLMDSFDVYFAAPVFITSSVDSTVTYYDCPPEDPDEPPYNIDVPGTFATEEKEITISYDVTLKDFPASGVLNVSIYDARRTSATANVQDEDLADPNGCGDFDSSVGKDNVASSSSIDDPYAQSISEYLLADDILGDSLPSQFELSVASGKASFTLPQIDRVALLEIHAEFKYGDGSRSVVSKQKVYYKNPLVLRLTGVGNAPADGETKVNVGATVWWKEEAPVEDGTIVNFETEKSNITPSISETINGYADGVLMGPHEPIPLPTTIIELAEGANKDVESVEANVSYRGFSTTKSGSVVWGLEPATNFYFYAKGQNTNPDSIYSGSQSLWSDGYDYITMNGDLPASSFRAFPSIEQVYQDLVDDRMGVIYTGTGLSVETRLPRWSRERPLEGPSETDVDVPYGWVTNRVYSNKFIGRPPYREPTDDPNPCFPPECVYVTMYTRSRKHDVVGTGIENETPTFPATTISGAPRDIPKPRVYPVEPLGITLSMEPVDRGEYQVTDWRETPLGQSPKGPGFDLYSHPINRDGESRYHIVAEITWKDEMIVNLANNPFPEVNFEIGTYKEEKGVVTLMPFSDPNEAPLDSPTATVDHLRTTCDGDHYHEVTVDANGFGRTISTVSYEKGTVVAEHEHSISLSSSPIVSEETVGTLVHGHALRSVAIVGMGPVRNRTLPIAVQGTVTYDNGKVPSSGTRVDRTLENYAFASPLGNDANPTLGYKLEIITVNKQYVEGKVTDAFPTRLSGSSDGYTVLYKATVVTPSGEEVPVEDGTRIFTDYTFYEFNDEDDESNDDDDVIIISREDEVKNYAVLKIDAFFSQFPDEAKADKEVMVTSDIRWFPSVEASQYIRKPETDPLSIQAAIDSFRELGSSQLNDAISLAAKRMIKFSDIIGDSRKIIVALSDMTESQSENSYDQALADVTSADAEDPVEIFPIKVSNVDQYSDLVAQKFATGSDGAVISITDIDDALQSASDAVEAIIKSPNFDVTSGTYTNVVDLGDTKLFNSLKFNTSVPVGTGLSFRIQFSTDGVTYGDWILLGSGNEFDISSASSFGRFMRYEVTFSGNPQTFVSPEFTGMEYDYFEPSGYTMFFQPIQIREGADGYVGEIIFTHQGTVPETSSVKYGIAHCNSSSLIDYGWNKQPLMKDGFGGIVLSRVNELLQKKDSVNYEAPYGGWNHLYDIEVYRISDGYPDGILVDPLAYSVDPTFGRVVFGMPQPSSDKFTITLGLNSEFRIVVDMINYGEDTISLDYVGAMYRPVDRADMYGNTRQPVSSAVNTNLGEIEIAGEVSVSAVSFVTEMGDDSDVMKDVIRDGENYYVLVHDELNSNVYIAKLESNFTFIERYDLGDIGTPVSLDKMDGIWHLSLVNGTAISVLRVAEDFTSISLSDFGFVDEHPAVIRSVVDRWYTPNGSTIDVFNRSFQSVESIALQYDIAPVLHADGTMFSAFSEKKDILFDFSLDGTVSKAYSLVTRPVSVANIRRYDDMILMVEPYRIVQGEIL